MVDVAQEVARSVTAAHVQLYRSTRGILGGFVAGRPVLLLITRGRRTGESRTTPLSYFRVDGRIFVIASYGGARRNPGWYLNLQSNDHVQVQRWNKKVAMVARTVTGPDRDRVWSRVALLAPIFRWYQQRTDREIPVVELVPLDDSAALDEPPVAQGDLDAMNKGELMKIARRIDLSGRSKMNKADLLKALRARDAAIDEEVAMLERRLVRERALGG